MPSPHSPDQSRQRLPSATAYRRTHHGEEYPASIIHQYVEENGLPDAVGLASLAARVKLPESTLRSTLSYYADYRNWTLESAHGTKSCNGTSCFLSSSTTAKASAPGHCASCLGHCYQENNYLLDNEVKSTTGAAEMSIQCLAPPRSQRGES